MTSRLKGQENHIWLGKRNIVWDYRTCQSKQRIRFSTLGHYNVTVYSKALQKHGNNELICFKSWFSMYYVNPGLKVEEDTEQKCRRSTSHQQSTDTFYDQPGCEIPQEQMPNSLSNELLRPPLYEETKAFGQHIYITGHHDYDKSLTVYVQYNACSSTYCNLILQRSRKYLATVHSTV